MTYLWIILIALLIAINGGLLGTLLVLKRQALMSDAVSHALLPGLVLAYVISQSRHSLPMMLGAVVCGIIAILVMDWLGRRQNMHSEASLGIVYTFLFAVGIILISRPELNVDIDQDCVLYGEIAYAPFDQLRFNELKLGPRGLYLSALNVLITSLFIYFGRRGIKSFLFNEQYAESAGLLPKIWRISILSLTALSSVLQFELIGSILVLAFMVIPAATALLISKTFSQCLKLSCAFASFSSIGGFLLAYLVNGSVSGAIASVSLLIFMTVFLIKVHFIKFFRRIMPKFQKANNNFV